MTQDEIERQILDAIDAHGAWKTRLRRAARDGAADFDAAELARDDTCAFGQWLCSIERGTVAPGRIERIKKMHRAFHAEAGRVAALIQGGRMPEAREAFDIGSPFMERSATLIDELSVWRVGL
jgi:hypothetical protein